MAARGADRIGVEHCRFSRKAALRDATAATLVGTLKLKRGQITLQGLIEVQGEDDPGPFTVAITGGTGRYVGAGGKAVIRELSPTRSVYKLRFTSSKKHHPK